MIWTSGVACQNVILLRKKGAGSARILRGKFFPDFDSLVPYLSIIESIGIEETQLTMDKLRQRMWSSFFTSPENTSKATEYDGQKDGLTCTKLSQSEDSERQMTHARGPLQVDVTCIILADDLKMVGSTVGNDVISGFNGAKSWDLPLILSETRPLSRNIDCSAVIHKIDHFSINGGNKIKNMRIPITRGLRYVDICAVVVNVPKWRF